MSADTYDITPDEDVIDFEFNPRRFNPLYWHIESLLLDDKIRYLLIEGGSSAAKTFTICQALLIAALVFSKSTLVFRRFHVHIKDSTYASFRAAAASLDMTDLFLFQQDNIYCRISGARIVFKGLDNEENIKGIEGFDYVYCNEWNQFLEKHWKQMRKRLRGRPGQKFICDWNPVSAKLWLYENWIDMEEWTDMPLDVPTAPTKHNCLNKEYAFKRINAVGNMVNIKVTYRDNFWIVGHPSGKGGFIDVETLRDFELDRVRDTSQYRIYANGERGILRMGGEFWQQFNPDTHVKPVCYMPGPVHVSCDQNADPYVTVAVWQVFGFDIKQIKDLPCKAPHNNAVKAAKRFIDFLIAVNHQDVVYLYGDPSGNNRNVIDEDGRTFFDKFTGELINVGLTVVSRVAKSHPSVSMSRAFIDSIYEYGYGGYTITIGDNCRESIDDYCMVKMAPDGTMLKLKEKHPITDKMYERWGHFSDAKRDFLTQLLSVEFQIYRNRLRKGGSVSGGRRS